MTRSLFVDSTAIAHAFGGPSPHVVHSLAILSAAHDGDVELHLSTEAVQELVFHRMRRGTREHALAVGRQIRHVGVIHDFDVAVLDRSLDLIAQTPIRGRDAVHAATALTAGFDRIVTTDADFEVVPGLRAVSPEQALAD